MASISLICVGTQAQATAALAQQTAPGTFDQVLVLGAKNVTAPGLQVIEDIINAAAAAEDANGNISISEIGTILAASGAVPTQFQPKLDEILPLLPTIYKNGKVSTQVLAHIAFLVLLG